MYARKLYNDEVAGLTITTDSSAGKHIDILSGSITLGKLASSKNVMIQEGTLTVGDDLLLKSDGAVLNFGVDSDVSLTHVADAGLLLNAGMQLQFRNSNSSINSSTAGQLDIDSSGELEITAPIVDIDASTEVNISNALKVAGTFTLGAGQNEFTISESSDNITIKNTVSDKDVIFNVNDGGSDTEVMRLDGSASTLLMASDKKIEFRDTGLYINSSTDGQLDIDADTELEITAPTVDINASTEVNISNALKVAGTFTLGAGQDEFTISESSDDITIKNTKSDKDVIFNVNDNGSDTEVMRLDGSESSLLMASGKKIEFASAGSGEYISGDGTDLSVISGGALTYTAGASSTWGVTGDLKMDVSGDIVLDADGDDIAMVAGGAGSLTFVHSNTGDWSINNSATKDIIFCHDEAT